MTCSKTFQIVDITKLTDSEPSDDKKSSSDVDRLMEDVNSMPDIHAWIDTSHFSPHDVVCQGQHEKILKKIGKKIVKGKPVKASPKKTKFEVFSGQWCKIDVGEELLAQVWPANLDKDSIVVSHTTESKEYTLEPLQLCPLPIMSNLTASLVVYKDNHPIPFPDQLSDFLLEQFGIITTESDTWMALTPTIVQNLFMYKIPPSHFTITLQQVTFEVDVLQASPSPLSQITPSTIIQPIEPMTDLLNQVSQMTITETPTPAGLEIPFDNLYHVVQAPLKYAQELQKLNVEPPRGVLLHGPSGVGKSLLVQHVANKLGAKLITIRSSNIFQSEPGEGERWLRQTWHEAEKHSLIQPVIICLDNVDVLAPKRSNSTQTEAGVLSQLLTLMDGVQRNSPRLFIIATTTIPNNIDSAMRRPGRLDKEILIPVPDQTAREAILSNLFPNLSSKTLAMATPGYTPADLIGLHHEALILANGSNPEMVHFQEALMRQPSSSTKSHTVEYLNRSNLSWDDVGGLENVKRALRQAIEWPTMYPATFARLGLERPRGILLFGPPGCSKTRLVRVMAHVIGFSSFLTLNAANLYNSFVGESERILREVFLAARMAKPSIVFLDEIDALAGSRDTGQEAVQSRILATLLNEMDGISAAGEVLVMAATNRPEHVDSALLRPGRFDRCIHVPPPDEEARLQILKIHSKNSPLDSSVDLMNLARDTQGYSGADLENLIREAALHAVQSQRQTITIQDVEVAFKRLGGPSISREMIQHYESIAKQFERV